MNAAEARKLAVENASKLANQYCKEPLVKIDRKINYAVKFGRFSVSVKFCPDDIWHDFECTEFIKEHLEQKGFKTNTTILRGGQELYFIVYWGDF